jgi:hypothetical protein
MKYGNIQKDNFYLEIKHNIEDDFSQCFDYKWYLC